MLLTFDLDGVLMKNPFSTGVFPTVTKEFGKISGLSHKEIMAKIIQEAKERMDRGDFVGAYDWDGIVAVVGKELGYDKQIDVAGLVRQFCTPDHIYAYPHVHETLEELKYRGFTLVALTNGFLKYQLPVLESLGIAQFFEKVFTPELIGQAKPHPEFFQKPQQAFPGRHLHIGDTVIHDLWGPKRVGATTVWVYHDLPEEISRMPVAERTKHELLASLIAKGIERDLNAAAYPEVTVSCSMPDFVIKSIEELLAVLDKMEGNYAKQT